MFSNLFFEFTSKEFEHFKVYIRNIDVDYWEHKNACGYFRRNIPIPTLQQNLVLLFHKGELEELKFLLQIQQKKDRQMLRVDEIDYTPFLN